MGVRCWKWTQLCVYGSGRVLKRHDGVSPTRCRISWSSFVATAVGAVPQSVCLFSPWREKCIRAWACVFLTQSVAFCLLIYNLYVHLASGNVPPAPYDIKYKVWCTDTHLHTHKNKHAKFFSLACTCSLHAMRWPHLVSVSPPRYAISWLPFFCFHSSFFAICAVSTCLIVFILCNSGYLFYLPLYFAALRSIFRPFYRSTSCRHDGWCVHKKN